MKKVRFTILSLFAAFAFILVGAIIAPVKAKADDIDCSDPANLVVNPEDGEVVCFGTKGRDTITGTKFDDSIEGGECVVIGGALECDDENGDDLILGGKGDDKIRAGGGNDTIDSGDGRDDIGGGNGNDAIFGGDGDDDIKGQDGNDVIAGGRGNDDIKGQNGNDDIDGGDGNDDMCDGGKGIDTFANCETVEDE